VRPITFHGALLGTPAYMSPEQALGEPIDLRADLYSLGLVLYEAATGVLPFASKTLQETLAGRLLFQAPALRTYCADISPAFEAIILRSLSKRREARFSSAKEMGEQLSLAAKSEPLQFSRPQSKEHLYAKSLANNPWDEPEFTMHQDVSREDNSKANAALSLQKTDPLLSARTLTVENPLQEATWNDPLSQKFELREVSSVEERTLREKIQPRRPPVTFDECLSSQEFVIEEVLDDNDVDVPTENSREKPRLK
jgi:serine/threonine protein kinase